MDKVAVPIILAVLLGALAIFWHFMEPESQGFKPGDQVSLPEVQTDAMPRRNEVQNEDPPLTNPERSTPESAPFSEPVEDGFLIRCIMRATGAAVPGAEVLVALDRNESRREIPTLLHDRPIQDYFANAVRYRADEKGLVRIAFADEDRAQVRAQSSVLQGDARIESSIMGRWLNSITIELAPVTSVAFRVVDQRGRPVVAAKLLWSIEGLAPFDDRTQPNEALLFQGSTGTLGPEGRAQIAISERAIAAHSWLLVHVAGVFREPVAIRLPTLVLPQTLQTLVLPICGSVDVSFRPLPGTSTPKRIALRLREKTGKIEQPKGTQTGALDFIDELVDSRLKVPFVEIGLELECQLEAGLSATFEAIESIVAGPKTAGENIAVALSPPAEPDRMILVGRLLSPKADVVADQDLTVGWRDDRDRHLMDHLFGATRTDAEGQFQIGFPVSDKLVGQAAIPRFLVRSPTGGSFSYEWKSVPFQAGLLDLGDVPLSLEPLLAAGLVRDQCGRPVAGVKLNLWASDPQFVPRSYSARTDAQGRYSFHGARVADQVHISCFFNLGGEARDEVPVGTTDVNFEVLQLAGLKLDVTADDPTVFEALQVTLSDTPGQQQGFVIPADGHVHVPVKPGRYDLRISPFNGSWSTDYRRDGLDLVAGETLDLGTIALKETGTVLRLRFVDADNQPIERGRINLHILEPGASKEVSSLSTSLGSGSFALMVPHLPIDIDVNVEGYRPRRCTIESASEAIQLAPSLAARITVVGLGELQEDISLNFCLRSTEKATWNQQVNTTMSRGHMTQLVGMPVPGRFEIDAFVVLTPKRGAKVEDILLLDPAPMIEVRTIEGEQEFPIRIDEAAFRKTVTELRSVVVDSPPTPRGRDRERSGRSR